MTLTLTMNHSAASAANYLTWSPSPCTLQQDGATPLDVRLHNANTTTGGQLVFRKSAADPFSDTLDVTVPGGNVPLDVQVAGKFGKASKADKDATLEVIDLATSAVIASRALMVRIRKNAEALDDDERDRFLSAMVRLNSPNANGLVPFLDIVTMHVELAQREIHGRDSFLPWHRAYVLDLERRLQEIDPSVTVPYWRFDQAAPRLFTREFIGVPLANGIVDFTAENPLINWINRLGGAGNARVRRYNGMAIRDQAGNVTNFVPFDPTQGRAIAVSNGQNDTINLGRASNGDHFYELFMEMEGDPHGAAHVSFYGQISSASTAAADPLFFLLHCNVDRLWARWQWLEQKYDPADFSAYSRIGHGNPSIGGRDGIGNYTQDTMWPWNGAKDDPRPPNAPGGPFRFVEHLAPTAQPTVGSMIDYLGQLDAAQGGVGNNLGFAYDDIPFET